MRFLALAILSMLTFSSSDAAQPSDSVTRLPVRFELVEGRMIVVSAAPQDGAPPAGAEITAIDGVPVPKLIAEFAPRAKRTTDRDFGDEDFNDYWSDLRGFPDRWTIYWKRADDLAQTQSALKPISIDAWTALSRPAPHDRGSRTDIATIQTAIDFISGFDQTLVIGEKGTMPASSLDTALAGNWSGLLDYRDFGTDKRVTLPTRMAGSPDGTGIRADFTYDDGPGKIVRSSEHWALSADGNELSADGDTYRVVERLGGPGPGDMTLVADGVGQENDRPVEARLTLARRNQILTISRQTRRPGEPYILRHALLLHRS